MKEGYIDLGGGFKLIVPQYSSTGDILKAIGILTSVYIVQEIQETATCDEETLKAFFNEWVHKTIEVTKDKFFE